jgi:hypothetical protein
MHDTLVQKLTGSNDASKSIFAPFDALSLLIGDKNARSFCQQHLGISARPPLNNPSHSHSNQASSSQTITIDDNDMDVDADNAI